MVIRVGILSDTHLSGPRVWFEEQVKHLFYDCSVILHAGDLTELTILEAFHDKELHAVHGNMCSAAACRALPKHELIRLAGYSIGLCHGAGPRHNIEERMWDLFPTADCIVYGHTHVPVCHRAGKTLFLNPGSFAGTGRWGAPGSYAMLLIDDKGLHGTLHTVPEEAS